MHREERELAERAIRAACQDADFERAATLLVRTYGSEIMGFLAATVRQPEDAADVFSTFGELVWKSLSRFEWRSSARTWAYVLARRAAVDHFRAERRRGAEGPLGEASHLSRAIVEVRSQTAPYLRTDVKDRFQLLRHRLPEEDQMVLILRVDRGLSWTDVAEVMRTETKPSNPADLKREAARLRKRFQLAKESLRKMALDEGLLD